MWETASLVPLIGSFTVVVALVATQAIARSRAGLGLTIAALVGALVLAFSERRREADASNGSAITPTRLLVAAVGVAVIFAVQFALYRIMQRFAVDPLEDARLRFTEITLTAAKAYFPFGSGMGTFPPVYAMFEQPQDALQQCLRQSRP